MDRPGAEQSYIMAGHLVAPLDVDSEPAIDAMNEILGGSFTSRINMNLREDKGWSYGVQSLVLNTQAQRPFLALAPVQSDRTADSIREMLTEFDNYLGAEPATDQEVETAKRTSTLTLPGRWETAGDIARDLQELERYDLPDDYWDRYADLVNAVDTEAVAGAARTTLRPDELTWLIVGDLRTIQSEVEALGIGPVAIIDTDGRIINTP
jgi:zinc protease